MHFAELVRVLPARICLRLAGMWRTFGSAGRAMLVRWRVRLPLHETDDSLFFIVSAVGALLAATDNCSNDDCHANYATDDNCSEDDCCDGAADSCLRLLRR